MNVGSEGEDLEKRQKGKETVCKGGMGERDKDIVKILEG